MRLDIPPKMDYVIVTKSDMPTLVDTILSIKKQSNVNRIIVVQSELGPENQLNYLVGAVENKFVDVVKLESVGLAYARMLGIQAVETEYFVFVDGDVLLCDEWAELMWERMDNSIAIFGKLYRNRVHEAYLRTYDILTRFVYDRMFTHNTIIRTVYVKDWRPPRTINAYEDYLLTRHIYKRAKGRINPIKVVPVFSHHNHQGSDLKAAMWGGAGARMTERYTSFGQVARAAFKNILGGIKRTFKMNSDWFTVYALRQGFGMMWGYLRYGKYWRKPNIETN